MVSGTVTTLALAIVLIFWNCCLAGLFLSFFLFSLWTPDKNRIELMTNQNSVGSAKHSPFSSWIMLPFIYFLSSCCWKGGWPNSLRSHCPVDFIRYSSGFKFSPHSSPTNPYYLVFKPNSNSKFLTGSPTESPLTFYWYTFLRIDTELFYILYFLNWAQDFSQYQTQPAHDTMTPANFYW